MIIHIEVEKYPIDWQESIEENPYYFSFFRTESKLRYDFFHAHS